MLRFCTICQRIFASNFNYNRHMETAHPEPGDKEGEETKSNNESEDESENEESERGDSDESGENSEESEDSDSFTYDEVRAILRYHRKSNES